MGNARLGKKHIHLTWHATSHWVDAESEIDALLLARFRKLAHRTLRSCLRHAVTWNDKNLLCIGQQVRYAFDAGLGVLLWSTAVTFRCWSVVETSENNIDNVSVHGITH